MEIPGYKIIKTLGVGGQATVYLAIQEGFEREVALKVMSPALAADPSFGERFLREAKIVAKLSHARIVTVYDVGESGSFYYLAMEYMRGTDLKLLIAKGIKNKDALLIVAKLAQALHFAHQKGYIHRDVKSENILFDDDKQPVLTDFGIAKASNSSTQMTQTGKLIGTPEYMSPEQCRGKALDGRSDLYSLGIILFEMLTRKVPFTGEDSVSVCIKHVTKPVPLLPARLNHLQWLIDGLLAKNPDDRYQNGKELAVAIKSYLGSGVQGGTTSSTSQTQISQAGISQITDKTNKSEIFDNEEFELNDKFNVEQRITVLPEPKSGVAVITISFILIIASGFGYLKRDNWLPQAQELLGVNWFETNKNQLINKVAEKVEKSQVNEKEVAIKTDKTNQEVDRLIQQADTLAHYSPHELIDIKQALDLLITAKSLSPTNPDVNRVRNDIVAIALVEALTSAENKLFINSGQWLEMVAFADKDNEELNVTRQRVQTLKQAHLVQIARQENEAKLFEDYIDSAERALVSGRLGNPKDDNALHFYKKALEINADDERINKGFLSIEKSYIKLVEQAIKDSQFPKAKTYLESIKTIPSYVTDISIYQNEINQKQKLFNDKHAKNLEVEKRDQQIKLAENQRQEKLANPLVKLKLDSNLQAASDLLQQGKLVEPAGNNALEKFNSALEVDSLNKQALNGIKTIERTIITNLEVALSNRLLETSEVWLNKLILFNPKSVKLDKYRNEFNLLKKINNEEVANQQDMPVKDKKIEVEDVLDEEIFNDEIPIEKKSNDLIPDNEVNNPEP